MNFRELGTYFRKNGPGIATAVSMVLTGLSVYFAIRKAEQGVNVHEEYLNDCMDLAEVPLADRKKNDALALKLNYGIELAKTYKESLVCAGGAMLLTYLANKENGKTIAGLTAALAINEDKLRKVYAKAENVFGKGGADDLKEAVNCDIPPFSEAPVKGRVRHRKEEICEFYESFTGTPFESTMGDVEDAIARAKKRMLNDPRHTLNFNKWRSLLGLMDVDAGISVGWHRTDVPFEPTTKIVYIDGREMVGIFYGTEPTHDYDSRNYY